MYWKYANYICIINLSIKLKYYILRIFHYNSIIILTQGNVKAHYYLHIFIYTFLSTHFYPHIFIYTFSSTHFYLHIFIYTFLSTHFYLHIFIYTFVPTHFYLHIFIYIFLTTHFIHTFISTHLYPHICIYTFVQHILACISHTVMPRVCYLSIHRRPLVLKEDAFLNFRCSKVDVFLKK